MWKEQVETKKSRACIVQLSELKGKQEEIFLRTSSKCIIYSEKSKNKPILNIDESLAG